MKRASPSLLNLGAGFAAAGGIGAGYAGLLTGSTLLLVIALLCALICALLQGLAFQRAAGRQLDGILADLRALRVPADDGRRR